MTERGIPLTGQEVRAILDVSRDTEEWYEWRNGGYVRVENQTAYREALRAAYDEAEKQPRRARPRTTEEAAVESRSSHG